ncbi:dihydroxyacetone kinase phosphotransfer subunit [Sporomusaceae bacterium BoRhaA]|uniref:dihydroxyacetone kinase phosphoryl donor subunit DhaM n=1 Tax=Pelorhabdus rhamnosifermentans TaxID=2772457 RepID=UPI001C063C5C|nr:dihydroxyacetone kinase phosphoryl donor subunit DhaM [Pelorhabdus rhamnosifermentans]MBU2700726.1 dihydroxyacetone kinase phosphotransfer subunit [Pelorhabdus rhamnosifermentans]
MVGIVLVSHHVKIAEGIKELAAQMAMPDLKIIAAGGLEDGSIGTDALRISEAVREAQTDAGVVILADLGSAVMSSETALEFLDEEVRRNVKIADAPIVEGAVAAVVQASIGGTVDEVLAAAEGARDLHKC